MAIRRMVTYTCDGPCGRVIPDTEKTPLDWFYVKIEPAAKVQGVKGGYSVAALCPSCLEKVKLMMSRCGFSFSDIPVKSHEE